MAKRTIIGLTLGSIVLAIIVFFLIPRTPYKTFSNRAYGFRFEYPRSWKIEFDTTNTDALSVDFLTIEGSLTGESYLVFSASVGTTPPWFEMGATGTCPDFTSIHLGNQPAKRCRDVVPTAFFSTDAVSAKYGAKYFVLYQRESSDSEFQNIIDTFEFTK